MHERSSCRPEAYTASVPDGRERLCESEVKNKRIRQQEPSTGWAAVSPTSVCCDRLHISPPALNAFLRLVVSGWRREGNLLRLTMLRCT